MTTAGALGFQSLIKALDLIAKLKKFVRPDVWTKLSNDLKVTCQDTCAKNMTYVSKASKKEIGDFTDTLERILITAYKVTHHVGDI